MTLPLVTFYDIFPASGFIQLVGGWINNFSYFALHFDVGASAVGLNIEYVPYYNSGSSLHYSYKQPRFE